MKFLEDNIEDFVKFFYDDFFNSNPKIKNKFRNTELDKQAKELEKGLVRIIKLGREENQEKMEDFLIKLGIRHVTYEVGTRDYEDVKKSLNYAMSQIAKNMNEVELKSYEKVFDLICTKMIDGSKLVKKVAQV